MIDVMSREKILGAQELFESFSNYRNSSTPPPLLGAKANGPSSAAVEFERTKSSIRGLKELLEIPRVAQRSQISEAEYRVEDEKVVVRKPAGKYWNTLGHYDESVGSLCLYPEEALFLLETNRLEITFDSVPISVQQGYHLFLSSNGDKNRISFDEYFVYSELSRLGYKVVRHESSRVRKNEEALCVVEGILDNLLEEVFETLSNRVGISDDDDDDEMNAEMRVPLPNFYGKNRMTFDVPPVELLPPNSYPQKSVYVLDLEKNNQETLRRFEIVRVQSDNENEEEEKNVENSRKSRGFYPEAVFNCSPPRKGTKRKFQLVQKVRKSRRKVESSPDNPDLIEGPLASLWRGRTKPLIQLGMATSTPDVLKRLDIFSKSNSSPQSENRRRKIKISFDVHLPTAPYKKSQPRLPEYRVSVVSSTDPVPVVNDYQYCGVPLLLAVVTPNGAVSFFNFSKVHLPVLMSE